MAAIECNKCGAVLGETSAEEPYRGVVCEACIAANNTPPENNVTPSNDGPQAV